MGLMTRAQRSSALLITGAGLLFQLVLLGNHGVLPRPVTLVLVASVGVLAGSTLLGARTWAWAAGWVTSALLGLDFAGAVADRFGAFGGLDGPGVSWGSWSAFVDYTARLLPAFDRWVVVLAAASATVVEVVLAGLLLCGWQRRWVGSAAAGLLTVYLLAMGLALGADSVGRFAMPVLVGGALLVSSTRTSRPRLRASSRVRQTVR
jgi:hypothetical protein